MPEDRVRLPVPEETELREIAPVPAERLPLIVTAPVWSTVMSLLVVVIDEVFWKVEPLEEDAPVVVTVLFRVTAPVEVRAAEAACSVPPSVMLPELLTARAPRIVPAPTLFAKVTSPVPAASVRPKVPSTVSEKVTSPAPEPVLMIEAAVS